MSIALVFAAIGCVIGGLVSDICGRKISILVADVVFCLGSGTMWAAPSLTVLMLGRALEGLAIGMIAMAVPV